MTKELNSGTKFRLKKDYSGQFITHYLYNKTTEKAIHTLPVRILHDHIFIIVKKRKDTNTAFLTKGYLCRTLLNNKELDSYLSWNIDDINKFCEIIEPDNTRFNRGSEYTKNSPWEFL